MYHFHSNLKQLGLTEEEIKEFDRRIHNEYGRHNIGDINFLFECIRLMGEKIQVLKDQISDLKQEKMDW